MRVNKFRVSGIMGIGVVLGWGLTLLLSRLDRPHGRLYNPGVSAFVLSLVFFVLCVYTRCCKFVVGMCDYEVWVYVRERVQGWVGEWSRTYFVCFVCFETCMFLRV